MNRSNQISLNAPEGIKSHQGELKTKTKTKQQLRANRIATTASCLRPGKGLEPPSVRQTRDFYLKASIKLFILCSHKTQNPQGVFGEKETRFSFQKLGEGKFQDSKPLLCKVPDVRRPIFKIGGGKSLCSQ